MRSGQQTINQHILAVDLLETKVCYRYLITAAENLVYKPDKETSVEFDGAIQEKGAGLTPDQKRYTNPRLIRSRKCIYQNRACKNDIMTPL